MIDHPLNERETDLYTMLTDVFGDTISEMTAHILFYIVHNYLIGIRYGEALNDWTSISLTQRGTANIICHFHVIDHPEGWHNYVYWYHFINNHNPYDLPIEYETQEAVILTQIANHPRVVIIASDESALTSIDPEAYLH